MPGAKSRKSANSDPVIEEEDGCYNCGSKVNSSMMNSQISSRDIRPSGKIEGKELCSWFEIAYLVKELANKTVGKRYDCILGISNGGIIPAKLLAEELGLDTVQLIPIRNKTVVVTEMPRLDNKKKYLVIDDIYDTGKTFALVSKALKGYDCDYVFCMSRYEQSSGISGRVLNHSRWIVFPWERPDSTPS
jgi:uncharacterized protein